MKINLVFFCDFYILNMIQWWITTATVSTPIYNSHVLGYKRLTWKAPEMHDLTWLTFLASRTSSSRCKRISYWSFEDGNQRLYANIKTTNTSLRSTKSTKWKMFPLNFQFISLSSLYLSSIENTLFSLIKSQISNTNYVSFGSGLIVEAKRKHTQHKKCTFLKTQKLTT